MQAIIDWLSFTVKEYGKATATPQGVIKEILKLDPSMFQPTKEGHGYKAQIYYNSIKIYFNGTEEMGVHVQISGEGIRYIETAIKDFDWVEFFKTLMETYKAKLTRLDVAVDDTEGIIDLELLEEKIKSGEIVSRWKYRRPVCNYKLSTGEVMGKTLYFGNRGSEIMCRFYNKREQEKKKFELEGKELPEHWVRCELEMRAEKANTFARLYYMTHKERTLGMLFHEVLSNYMRVTDKGTDTNRSRWNMCEMWERFNTALINMRLSLHKQMKKLEDSYVWVKKSVAPTLFTLFKASGGDLDFFMELVKEGGKRISKKHFMMLEEYENREVHCTT